MANIKDTLKNAGEAVKEKAGEAADWVKEKTGMGGCGSPSDIRPHMDVIASCGTKVGKVDHADGGSIKLTKNDSPDGQHHFIPTAWVDHVDNHVHLNKNSDETRRGWTATAGAASSA